jgi:hypothetical protein
VAERLTDNASATLLSERLPNGTIPLHPYSPLREQVLSWLLSDTYERRWVPPRHGRCRMHASLDANAAWALTRLGLADERVDPDRPVARCAVAGRRLDCDPRPTVSVSSFEETLIPLRELALRSDAGCRDAADRAAEVFLTRRLHRRLSDGKPIAAGFLKLHFPAYWHYDVLFGLKVMHECGRLGDPRCADALEMLDAKRLPDGGFPAEARFYRRDNSTVDWGETSVRRSNPWVTAEALAVLS